MSTDIAEVPEVADVTEVTGAAGASDAVDLQGTTAVGAPPASGGAPTAVDRDDPREQIEVGVLLPNGRLVGRRFASRAEAEAWARPDEGEQVVEWNLVCECSV